MNKGDTQNPECDYSFEMLYRAAFGKSLKAEEKLRLQSLSQTEVNKLVIKWTKKCGWKTESKKGSNGITYLAFHP
jgi:hypothetical protein